MALHDLVKDGAIVGEPREFAETPTLAPNKNGGARWLPRYFPNPEFEPGPDEALVVTPTFDASRVVYSRSGVARPLADLKAEFYAAVMVKRDLQFARHFRPTAGALDGKAIACLTDEDRTNWLTLRGRWKDAIAADLGDTVGARFRTVDNVNIDVPFSQGVAYLDEMTDWGNAIYQRSWDLKDDARDAEDLATFQAVRETLNTGWPA